MICISAWKAHKCHLIFIKIINNNTPDFFMEKHHFRKCKNLLFLCNYRAETHLALMFTPCVSPSDSTHTHPSKLCRWCSQSKSMCVSVAVVAYVYSSESWRSEANRWAASSECCEITECVALLTAPDGQREPSLSVKKNSQRWFRVSLSDTDKKCEGNWHCKSAAWITIYNRCKTVNRPFYFPKVMHFKAK